MVGKILAGLAVTGLALNVSCTSIKGALGVFDRAHDFFRPSISSHEGATIPEIIYYQPFRNSSLPGGFGCNRIFVRNPNGEVGILDGHYGLYPELDELAKGNFLESIDSSECIKNEVGAFSHFFNFNTGKTFVRSIDIGTY